MTFPFSTALRKITITIQLALAHQAMYACSLETWTHTLHLWSVSSLYKFVLGLHLSSLLVAHHSRSGGSWHTRLPQHLAQILGFPLGRNKGTAVSGTSSWAVHPHSIMLIFAWRNNRVDVPAWDMRTRFYPFISSNAACINIVHTEPVSRVEPADNWESDINMLCLKVSKFHHFIHKKGTKAWNDLLQVYVFSLWL